MQRGVYSDAWFPRQHCYHPSLPPRWLRMVDDLEDYRATVLVWAAMGGGSLALPYLEQEAFGDVGPRERSATGSSTAAHLLNYGYDGEVDAVQIHKDVELSVELHFDSLLATVVRPGHPPLEVEVVSRAGVHSVRLAEAGVYTIVVLRNADAREEGPEARA
jgi:hypothetical protein